MEIAIPENALVLMVGPAGSGKTSWARRHFPPHQILSSDSFRGLVAGDENDQDASPDAFEALHLVLDKRLQRNLLTVVDATNLEIDAREPLRKLAKRRHVQTVAIALHFPESVCQARNGARAERRVPRSAVAEHCAQMGRALKALSDEGFWRVYRFDSPEQAETASIRLQRLPPNLRDQTGPFDLIGDVHGCFDELTALLAKLGYAKSTVNAPPAHPNGRRAVFLGDLVDRGPNSPGVLRLAMAMVDHGSALCVPGNHDLKLARKLEGRDVAVRFGLAETLAQLEHEPASFKDRVLAFFRSLPHHAVLDGGRLVAAHAGMIRKLQGRVSSRAAAFALYGQTTGETDAYGLPIRYDWARDYCGDAAVVYGHTPVPEPVWLNNTICIDTGCVYGGKLTALRYPERELVQTAARRTYYEPVRPLEAKTP